MKTEHNIKPKEEDPLWDKKVTVVIREEYDYFPEEPTPKTFTVSALVEKFLQHIIIDLLEKEEDTKGFYLCFSSIAYAYIFTKSLTDEELFKIYNTLCRFFLSFTVNFSINGRTKKVKPYRLLRITDTNTPTPPPEKDYCYISIKPGLQRYRDSLTSLARQAVPNWIKSKNNSLHPPCRQV